MRCVQVGFGSYLSMIANHDSVAMAGRGGSTAQQCTAYSRGEVVVVTPIDLAWRQLSGDDTALFGTVETATLAVLASWGVATTVRRVLYIFISSQRHGLDQRHIDECSSVCAECRTLPRVGGACRNCKHGHRAGCHQLGGSGSVDTLDNSVGNRRVARDLSQNAR
jgi:hypothetical protein